jgi:hypothetical protein
MQGPIAFSLQAISSDKKAGTGPVCGPTSLSTKLINRLCPTVRVPFNLLIPDRISTKRGRAAL